MKTKLPKNLESGTLVYACVRKFKQTGRRRLILHEAKAVGDNSYQYGAGKLWTTQLKGVKEIR